MKWQLKKSKSWRPFSYQQNSQFGPIFEVNGLDWQCYLAGSSETAPRIFIFFNYHRYKIWWKKFIFVDTGFVKTCCGLDLNIKNDIFHSFYPCNKYKIMQYRHPSDYLLSVCSEADNATFFVVCLNQKGSKCTKLSLYETEKKSCVI